MIPTWRFIELTVYSILRIAPYLFFFAYIFKDHFRFNRWITVTTLVAITLLRCVCGYTAYFDASRLTDPNPGIMIFVVLSVLFVGEHFGKSLFTVWMLSNISLFVVAASKYLEGLFFGNMALEYHRYSNIITLLIVEAAVLIPLFFYIRNIYCKAVHQDTSKQNWAFLWIVPFTMYAVWYRNSFFSGESHEVLSLDLAYLVFCFLFSGGSMLIYTLITMMIKAHAENDRAQAKENLIAIQQAQYDDLQARIDEARMWRHDNRHHMTVMESYLDNGEYDKLKEYISHYRQTLPNDRDLIFCQHRAVNALLMFFGQMANDNGADYDVVAQIPQDIAIDEHDLTVLIGNLAENAAHACKTVISGPNYVTVNAKTTDSALYLDVSNTFNGPLEKNSKGLYLSTKREGRGLGLRSVRNIVEKYDGLLEITPKDGLFTVEIYLPFRKKDSP